SSRSTSPSSNETASTKRSVLVSLGRARSVSNATDRLSIALSSSPWRVFARLNQPSALSTRSAVALSGLLSSVGSKWYRGDAKHLLRSYTRSWLWFNPIFGTGGYNREPFTTQKG